MDVEFLSCFARCLLFSVAGVKQSNKSNRAIQSMSDTSKYQKLGCVDRQKSEFLWPCDHPLPNERSVIRFGSFFLFFHAIIRIDTKKILARSTYATIQIRRDGSRTILRFRFCSRRIRNEIQDSEGDIQKIYTGIEERRDSGYTRGIKE